MPGDTDARRTRLPSDRADQRLATEQPSNPSETHAAAPVLATGIGGLDDILDGGLPAERIYLVEGRPGAGKTTLALQFLLEGRNRGEACIYVTLSETRPELEEVARSHGWSLDGIDLVDTTMAVDQAASESQYTVFHPSEVELQDTVDRILARVATVQPRRVVLDSLSDMRLLARDPLRFRRQILTLKQFFAERGITVLLLDDQTADDADMQLHSLVHGVIALEPIVLRHGGERRRLRITKLRGVRFHAGFHDFVVRTGGLEVFPRIRLGAGTPVRPSGLVSSGSGELDALVGGGVPFGTSVLLTGAPGTGKSVLATQYAVAAARTGIRSAVYLFDERLGTFLERAAGLGMELEPHVRDRTIELHPLEPTEISPGEFTNRVRRAVDAGARIIVIDSLNGFTKAMAEEHQLAIKIHELLSYLGNRGVSTLLTLAQRGIFGLAPEDGGDLSYLSDAVVLLRYFESHGEVRRAVSVFKQRNANHERTIREFQIGPGGFALGAPLHEFQGVLTGVPTFIGGSMDLMANRSGEPHPDPLR